MSPRNNPVFWLMWLLPGATVVAGLCTLFIALHGADRPLPEAYHWEGDHLDRDFERQRRAAALGVEITLEAAGGQCVATVRGAVGDTPALDLLLTHGSDASLDRRVRLQRDAAGIYRGPCDAPPARWRIAIESASGDWSLRGQHEGTLAHVTLRARRPEGSAA